MRQRRRRDEGVASASIRFWGVFAAGRSRTNLAVTFQQSCEFVSAVLFYLRPYVLIPVSN